MAKFVKHEPCPSCGSRDNLGRYSDGSAYCFGCGYTERGSKSPFVEERYGKIEAASDELRLPSDATTTLDGRALTWIGNGGVSVREALQARMVWSPYWEQLLIPLYDRDGNLCCIQAKNFNPQRASKAKYYNTGDKNESRTVFSVGNSESCCLTEDVLSAIRVGRVVTGVPLLGTSISRNYLAELRKDYSRLIVWLDADKWRESRDIADAGKLLGFETKTIYTEQDPKSYTDEQIKEFLL